MVDVGPLSKNHDLIGPPEAYHPRGDWPSKVYPLDPPILPLTAPEFLRDGVPHLLYQGLNPQMHHVINDRLYRHMDVACYLDGNLIEYADYDRVVAGTMINKPSGQWPVVIIPLAIYRPRAPFVVAPPPPRQNPGYYLTNTHLDDKPKRKQKVEEENVFHTAHRILSFLAGMLLLNGLYIFFGRGSSLVIMFFVALAFIALVIWGRWRFGRRW